MPVELEVIRASEFVRLDPHERLDFEGSKKALEALAKACRKRGLDRAALDLRHLPKLPEAQFKAAELAALVRIFQEAGFSRHYRLAVLYHNDPFGGVRNFEFFSRMRGLQVQAFTEFEAALQWLSEEGRGGPKSGQGEVVIPITQPQPEGDELRTERALQPDRARSTRKRTGNRARR